VTRRKRPLTFVPAVLFLSTGMVALIGSTFYRTARESAAQVIRAVARPVQAAPADLPVSVGSCEVPEK
jgi:hypothetical protein